jgi:hypothetical protein
VGFDHDESLGEAISTYRAFGYDAIERYNDFANPSTPPYLSYPK